MIVDGHLDLAPSALGLGRDLTESIYENRHHEESFGAPNDKLVDKGWSKGTVAFPDMRRGDVGLGFANLISHVGMGYVEDFAPTYRSADNAFAAAVGQLSYYELMDRKGELKIITHSKDLNKHTKYWKENEKDLENLPIGIVIGMEGADPIINPENLDFWWKKGLRIISLVHYGIGRYAHGTGTTGGLLPQGKELLRAMEEKGVILDTTHLAEEAFWEALDLYEGPVIASHNNCRALVPGGRQFTDQQIKALAERNAVIGVALDSWMLNKELKRGKKDPDATCLADVAEHIDHICNLTGEVDTVAIGTDLDGGFGSDQAPKDIDTIADLQKLVSELEKRSYDEEAIDKIFHKNWLEALKSAWSN